MKPNKGFTLIEVMIVVAVLGILAAIAVPAYDEQMKRGRRADGKAFIMDMASRQERFYTQYSSYSSVVVGVTGCAGADCGLNYNENESPDGLYTAALALLPAPCAPTGDVARCTRYTITITPVAADPKCTTLTLNNLGEEGHTGSALEVEECWR